MGLFRTTNNKRLSFDIPHTPIWASMKVFKNTENASIRHQYEFETSYEMFCFSFFAAWHRQAFIPDGTPEAVASPLITNSSYHHPVPPPGLSPDHKRRPTGPDLTLLLPRPPGRPGLSDGLRRRCLPRLTTRIAGTWRYG